MPLSEAALLKQIADAETVLAHMDALVAAGHVTEAQTTTLYVQMQTKLLESWSALGKLRGVPLPPIPEPPPVAAPTGLVARLGQGVVRFGGLIANGVRAGVAWFLGLSTGAMIATTIGVVVVVGGIAYLVTTDDDGGATATEIGVGPGESQAAFTCDFGIGEVLADHVDPPLGTPAPHQGGLCNWNYGGGTAGVGMTFNFGCIDAMDSLYAGYVSRAGSRPVQGEPSAVIDVDVGEVTGFAGTFTQAERLWTRTGPYSVVQITVLTNGSPGAVDFIDEARTAAQTLHPTLETLACG